MATSLDRQVERVARDVSYLLQERILSPADRPSLDVPRSPQEAETIATAARRHLETDGGPLSNLQAACEDVGLLAFSLDLGPDGGDAAYVDAGGLGTAVVNGAVDPGRRRFDLAHELAHHLVGDAYASEVRIGDETEKYLNAVAIHLLMPREWVTGYWEQRGDLDRRLRVVAVAARFRVSWTAACLQLRTLGLIEPKFREELAALPPVRGEFFEAGEWWEPELTPPSVPPAYASRVVRAYRVGKLTASRTVELLHDTVTESQLPEVEAIPLAGLSRELDPL